MAQPGTLDALTALARGSDLAAEAVPLQPRDRTKVDISEIPLPPAHLVDELDNSDLAPAEEEPEPADDLVTLDFVGDAPPSVTFPLKYPFRWEGEVVRQVVVRQLTVAESSAASSTAGRPARRRRSSTTSTPS